LIERSISSPISKGEFADPTDGRLDTLRLADRNKAIKTCPPQRTADAATVAAVMDDLKRNPPKPFDLARQANVFISGISLGGAFLL